METISDLLKTKISNQKSLLLINKDLNEIRLKVIKKIDSVINEIREVTSTPKKYTSFKFRDEVRKSTRLTKYCLELKENKQQRILLEKNLKEIKIIIRALNISNSRQSEL